MRTPDAAVRDPRVVARGETVRLEHPKFPSEEDAFGFGLPIVFSDAEAGLDQPPPGVGEHNDLVYRELLGYPAERIAELRSRKVI